MDFTKLDEIYDSLKRNVEKFSEKTKTMEELEKKTTNYSR